MADHCYDEGRDAECRNAECHILLQPNLIFAGKAWSQPLGLSPAQGSALAGSSLACKYYTRLERPNRDKHSSLL